MQFWQGHCLRKLLLCFVLEVQVLEYSIGTSSASKTFTIWVITFDYIYVITGK